MFILLCNCFFYLALEYSYAAAAAKSLQSCLTLCDPRDGSPPGSPIPGVLQARTLEWVAISFFHAWKWKVKGKSLSRVQLLATPWTAAYHTPLSMGFSRQEHWSGLPLPSPNTQLWFMLKMFISGNYLRANELKLGEGIYWLKKKLSLIHPTTK